MKTTTTERPIIFKDQMIRAILDGRKTQTRRVVRPQPAMQTIAETFNSWVFVIGEDLILFPNGEERIVGRSPYGKIGDKLWVRETFAYVEVDGVRQRKVVYRCGSVDSSGCVWPSIANDPSNIKWKSPIYMPRWASRITLEITDVRVEQVQDISEDDARAEGVRGENDGQWGCEGLLEDFEELWDSIHCKDGLGWDANPWVWIITFKRVENN